MIRSLATLVCLFGYLIILTAFTPAWKGARLHHISFFNSEEMLQRTVDYARFWTYLLLWPLFCVLAFFSFRGIVWRVRNYVEGR